jgi:hypothetical protein
VCEIERGGVSKEGREGGRRGREREREERQRERERERESA